MLLRFTLNKNPSMTTPAPTLSNQLDRTWADRLVPLLNALIADFEVMKFNVRGAMWNGWGEQFTTMVDILPAYREHADHAVEILARRVRCLEGRPPATMDAMIENAHLEANDGTIHHRACIRMLRESLSHLLKAEREALTLAQHAGDEVSAQSISSLMSFQEEALWHLRSSLRRTAFETDYLPKEAP
jgi:starvation-inducible DNA-binding protein